MCLQTYLYHYCVALLCMLEGTYATHSLYYGICCVASLCTQWVKFFMPPLLRAGCLVQSPKLTSSLDKVEDIHKLICILRDRCNAALEVLSGTDPTATRCEVVILRSLLREIILPALKSKQYSTDKDAYVVYFGATDSFLASFAPLAGTECFDCIPGIYERAEEDVVLAYLDIVRNAPTITYLSGSRVDLFTGGQLVRSDSFKNKTGKASGMVHFDCIRDSHSAICKSIIEQWQCSDTSLYS